MDYSRTISESATCSRTVDTVDQLEARAAEVGNQKVRCYGKTRCIDAHLGGIRLDHYVPTAERVNISYLDLVNDRCPSRNWPLLGRVDVEEARGVGGMDCCC